MSESENVSRIWKIKKAALVKGYDSIVLMTPKAFVAYRQRGKIPRSIELNVLKP